MSTEMVLSVIVVQLDAESSARAFISYGSHAANAPKHTIELQLDAPTEVTDCRDWARQISAAVCEGL